MDKPKINRIRDVRQCRADELLVELSPHKSTLWALGASHHRDTSASWIFRGQSNGADGEIWPLTPSAFRPGVWDAFAPSANLQAVIGDHRDLRAEWEQVLVRDFLALADRHGFPIPDEDPIVRDPRLNQTKAARDLNSAGFYPFPAPAIVATFALAQHYGIPTRLVDWCWRPLVAAYFACEGVARRYRPGSPRPPNEAPFSIFALRSETQQLLEEIDFDPRIVRLTAAAATNPNLRAQGGLFSLVQPLKDDVPLPNLEEVLDRVEPYVQPGSEWPARFPLLVEYRVPAKDANWLLWQLSLVGVSGAFVYPGLRGVVDSIRERRFHHYNLLDHEI